MLLSLQAIRKILGIDIEVAVEPDDMAKEVVITFYPSHEHKLSANIINFASKLHDAFEELGVKVIPYEEALQQLGLVRRLKIFFYTLFGKVPKGVKIGKKIKQGVTVVSLGEGKTGDLVMDNTLGFAKNSVISILDMPPDIDNDTAFHKHFDTAMNLFAYHMTNIAIIVDSKKWIPYNFNASHPIYELSENFAQDILNGLIPKIAAPIKPPKLKEFNILKEEFDPFDDLHRPLVNDFLESGSVLETTGLYPPGKLLESLPFRNDFYKWIGKIHLDDRNGMSFGFLARQLPAVYGKVYKMGDLPDELRQHVNKNTDYLEVEDRVYIVLNMPFDKLVVEVPEVWVLTQRSGSKKTEIKPSEDLIKIGMKSGAMLMQKPKGLRVEPSYKPSFDTKVILAHAVGNAIIGTVLKYLNPQSEFALGLEKQGLALAHWHGYINPKAVPEGWSVYGNKNVPVSCSTFQSAIFALEGKLNTFLKGFRNGQIYLGDIHIEPHHGSNITYPSLKKLAEYLSRGQGVSKLGNYYLNQYHKKNI